MSYRRRKLPHDFSGTGQKGTPESQVYKSAGSERVLNTSILYSGLSYQRPVNQRDVEKLVRDWSDALFEPPIVSHRGGKYYLVDGQRRVSAIRKMNGGKDANVTCRVFYGMSYEDEALLLYRLDQAKKRMTLSQSTNARMISKQDGTMQNIEKILHEEGFQWMLDRRSVGDYKINATSAVLRAYDMLGRNNFSWMFSLLRQTWHGSPASLGAFMLNGLALFVKTYDTDIDEHTFIHRVGALDADKLLTMAKSNPTSSKQKIQCARTLRELYNKGCRTDSKLPCRGLI